MDEERGKHTRPARATVPPPVLDEIVRRLVAAVSPRRIILFGSHVYGQPGPESDLDVMILYDESRADVLDLTRRGYAALRGLRLPVELHFRPADVFDRWATVPASFEREIRDRGRVVYGAEG